MDLCHEMWGLVWFWWEYSQNSMLEKVSHVLWPQFYGGIPEVFQQTWEISPRHLGGELDHFQTDPNIRLFGISDTQIVRIRGKVLLYPSMFHVMHIINMYKYVCKCHL